MPQMLQVASGEWLRRIALYVGVRQEPHETESSLRKRAIAAYRHDPIPEPKFSWWGKLLRWLGI